MNPLLANGSISELRCGANFAYIFKNNDDYATTQYKVLRNQTSSALLPCVCARYNGRIELYYQTGEKKPFSSLLFSLDSVSFRAAVAGILAAAIQVKNVGFLLCENIDVSFDKIFIDTTTYQASLVYVPSKVTLYPDESAFENELRAQLIKAISGATSFLTPQTMTMATDLSSGKLSLEEVYQHIATGRESRPTAAENAVPQNENKSAGTASGLLKLQSINDKDGQSFLIESTPFVIGKSPDADGVLSDNKYISKHHCRISGKPGAYEITDLKSVNYSYLNKQKLEPEQAYPLHDGDIVRLANMDFRVRITEQEE